MPGSSVQQQFDAAVNLIRGLPKDGPFQPSNDMKLRLYGYFKQATEGPCCQPAPSFWDVVGKAKWGAWKSLGDMAPEQAMLSYVEEIKTVMETMSLTDDMASLMDTLGPVYEYVDDDRAARPARKKHVRFSADSAPPTNGHVTDEAASVNGHVSPPPENGLPAAADPALDGTAPGSELRLDQDQESQPHQDQEPQQEQERWLNTATSDTEDEDEFNDPIGEAELPPPPARPEATSQARLDSLYRRVEALTQMMDSAGAQMLGGRLQTACALPGPDSLSMMGPRGGYSSGCSAVQSDLGALARDLRADVDALEVRVRALETGRTRPAIKERPWWLAPELAPSSLLLLLCWPLLLQLAARLLSVRRRR